MNDKYVIDSHMLEKAMELMEDALNILDREADEPEKAINITTMVTRKEQTFVYRCEDCDGEVKETYNFCPWCGAKFANKQIAKAAKSNC